MREKGGALPFAICVLCLALVSASAASAAGPLRGKLDRAFGKGGGAVLAVGPTFANSYYTEMVRQPDGGIVLAGQTERVEGKYNEPIGFVQRRGPTGELDTGFGGGLVHVPEVGGLALQPDGRVLVGEETWACASASTVRRLRTDGSLDPSFGGDGISATVPLSVRHVAADPQGRVVVAGIGVFGGCNKSGIGDFELTLARLHPDGSLDRSFGQDGVVRATDQESAFSEGVAGLAIREDGSILVAGYRGLRAITPAGTPDQSFGTGGVVEVNGVSGTLLALPGGRVVLASSSAKYCCDNPGHFILSRYLPNGGLDPEFGGDGSVELAVGEVDTPTSLAAGPDGSVLLGGEVASDRGCPSLECDAAPFLARFTATGTLDPGFGQSGQATLDLPPRTRSYGQYVAALAIAPSGQILAAGSSGDGGDATVSALQPSGAPDAGFGSGGRATHVGTLPSVTDASDVAIGRDGSILASALSNAGAHRPRGILLAAGPDGAVNDQPGTGAEVGSELGVDGRGRFYAYSREGHVTRFDGRGQLDPGYGSGGRAFLPARFRVESLVVRRNGQALVIGRIKDHFGMAAFMLTPDGRPARRFGGDGLAIVGFGRKVKALALSAAFDRRGRVVIFGNYDPYYTAVVRLLPSGRLDPSFAYKGRQPYTPGLANEESAVAIAPDGGILIAAAPEAGINPLPTTLIRLRPDGIRDRGFGRNGVVRVDAHASMVGFFAGRRLILVSGADGFGDHGVAIRAFKPNGRPDRRFGHRGLVTARTSKVRAFRPAAAARQRNGKIVVAGTRGLIEESGSTVELLRFR